MRRRLAGGSGESAPSAGVRPFLGRLGKTDRKDALVLAQFAQSAESNGRLTLLRLADAVGC